MTGLPGKRAWAGHGRVISALLPVTCLSVKNHNDDFVNRNFRNKDLMEIERRLFGGCWGCSLGPRFKKPWNCVALDCKMGEL